jgi:hypothetical protein
MLKPSSFFRRVFLWPYFIIANILAEMKSGKRTLVGSFLYNCDIDRNLELLLFFIRSVIIFAAQFFLLYELSAYGRTPDDTAGSPRFCPQ